MSSPYILIVLACSNLRVIPERVSVDAYDKNYVDNVTASVRRYSRRGGYYFNAEANLKYSWGDNGSLQMVFYEFLHNEYRPSFVEFHFKKGCEMVNKDQYVGKVLKNALERSGLSCPIPAGHVVLSNMTISMDTFPYLWPFERAKAVTTVMFDKKFIANISFYLKFVQKRAN